MPGYLSNRKIMFYPAESLDLQATQVDLAEIESRVTDAEANIDDLSLNIGV